MKSPPFSPLLRQRFAIAAMLLSLRVLSHADTFLFPGLNHPIPDGQASGYADFETVSSSIHQIGSIEVSLNIVGNFNGDLYAYLQHGSALSVLLNRPGRTTLNPDGYDDSGFTITLNDFAAQGDIHNYRSVFSPSAGSPLTGAWQPDGRNVDPGTVLNTDSRTAMLSSFNGLDPNGTWTLFVADMAAGGTNMLSSWQLVINPVPEPSPALLLLLGGFGAALLLKRR